METPTRNLLTVAHEVRARAETGEVLIGLDFDGTLVPFAPRPEQVTLAPAVRALLAAVRDRAHAHLAIVSGRKLSDLVERVGLDGIAYAGNHGAEILWERGVGEKRFRAKERALSAQIGRALSGLMSDLPGVWIEDKGPVIALHYREASSAVHGELQGRLARWRDTMPKGVREREGNRVTEFLPVSLPGKGDALFSIATGAGIASPDRIVYVGDDDTDEEAFRALGPTAYTARIGPPGRTTSARFWIHGIGELCAFLESIARKQQHPFGRT